MNGVKLHLGCGKKYLQGYKHIDLVKYDHIDFVTSIDKLDMFEPESVEEIYACHCLEHFNRNDIENVLAEWYRVLLPSEGELRVAVPDFEAIVGEYIANRNLNQLIGLLYGGQNYKYNFHHICFDFSLLKDMLESVGFKSVGLYDSRKFLPDDFDDYSKAYLPHMNFSGRLMSLNVIARK